MVKLPQARKIVRKKKFERLTKEVKSKSIRHNRDPMLRSVRIATLDNDAILEDGKRKFSHQHTLKDGNMTIHQDTQKVPDAQKTPFCNNTPNCVPLMSDYKKIKKNFIRHPLMQTKILCFEWDATVKIKGTKKHYNLYHFNTH